MERNNNCDGGMVANISGGGREWKYCSATDGCSSHRVLVVQGNNRTVVLVVAALVVASVNGDREKQQNSML